MKHPALAVLAVAGLAACATTAQSDLVDAKGDLSRAVNAYGIAKGIADIAVAANPTLAPAVQQTESVVDPLIPEAQAMLIAADAEVPQMSQLVQEIQQQIVVIETETAQQVKVVAHG